MLGGTNSNEFQISKKAKVKKRCALCQKHRGVHTTHNTGECHKYEKDGTLQKSFSVKASAGKKGAGGGKKQAYGNSFAQVMERFSKLEKVVKKSNKYAKKKKPRHDSSDSSDSDSE